MSLSTLFSDAISRLTVPTVSASSSRETTIDLSHVPPDLRRLVRDRRYAQLLTPANSVGVESSALDCIWGFLEHDMAWVPGGLIARDHLVATSPAGDPQLVRQVGETAEIEAFYLDRDCVTEGDFDRFVQAGGYEDPVFWPEAILPNVLQFLDQSGMPGPAHWQNGRPNKDRQKHPVTGICWYEANAYATWAGKRLPNSLQWRRAGSWHHDHAGDRSETKYPWGNAFDPDFANLWGHGTGDTLPVDSPNRGATPNGVRHLIGNVWEWMDTQFEPLGDGATQMYLDQVMAEIRGGAFDTYFAVQATLQFSSGQPLLYRGNNIGFRCCVATSDLIQRREPDDTSEDFA